MFKKFIKINLIVLIIFVILNGQIVFAINEKSVSDISNILNSQNISDTSDTTEASNNQEENKIDSLQTEKLELEEKLNDTNNQIVYIQTELTNILYEIEELNLKILNNQEEIETLQAEENKILQFISSAEIELEKITLKYQNQKSLLEKRLVAMYKNNDITYLDVLLNSKSISEFISNYYLISELVEADEKLLNNVSNIKKNLEAINKSLAEKKKTLVDNKEKSEKMTIALKNMNAIKNSKISQLSQTELELHNKVSEYQKQISDIEKEIKLLAINSISPEYVGGIMAWPVPGYTRITSPFGMRTHPITGIYKLHTGVDIGAPLGANFIAANDGVVVKAGYNAAYGNMVIIDHGGGVSTLYAHGSEILVQIGQTVTRGESVLKVGSTGYSTGPHAHFEVRINGEYIEPLDYITNYTSISDTTTTELNIEN